MEDSRDAIVVVENATEQQVEEIQQQVNEAGIKGVTIVTGKRALGLTAALAVAALASHESRESVVMDIGHAPSMPVLAYCPEHAPKRPDPLQQQHYPRHQNVRARRPKRHR